MQNLLSSLADERLLAAQIERLAAQARQQGRLNEARGRAPSLAYLLRHRDEFARELAAAVREGAYRLSPARRAWVVLDKPRLLYSFETPDRVVLGALAHVLSRWSEPSLSPQLYSYRTGRSAHRAVVSFAAFVRRHWRVAQTPAARELFVLRADVKSYTDRIPTGDEQPLWDDLAALTGLARADLRAGTGACAALLRGSIRPELVGETATEVGLPMGSPVVPIVANWYLRGVDARLGAVPSAFYARFGDDLLFAHAQRDVVAAETRAVQGLLAARGLELNADKSRIVYLNAAGRPAPAAPAAAESVAEGAGVASQPAAAAESVVAAAGTCFTGRHAPTAAGACVAGEPPVTPASVPAVAGASVEVLGESVTAHGLVCLPRRKERRLLARLDLVFRRLAGHMVDAPLPARAAAMVAAANARLKTDPDARAAIMLGNDPGALRALDRAIGLAIVRRATGDGSVKALRRLPRKLLAQGGLWSLYAEKTGRAPHG